MEINIEKVMVGAKTRTLDASWTIEEPQDLIAQHGLGDVPSWLYRVFQWGSFGLWLQIKTYKLRKRIGWLSLGEILYDTLETEINREILEQLRSIADGK